MTTIDGRLESAIGITGKGLNGLVSLIFISMRAMMRLRIRVEGVMNAMRCGVDKKEQKSGSPD